MPARKSDKTSKPAVRKPAKRAAAQDEAATTLPESMVTGKASPAKAAVGDKRSSPTSPACRSRSAASRNASML